MVFQPMLDVLTYLRTNGYKTYIVSGGGVEFMRPWVERAYGIPPEQVVGSRAKVKYEVRDGVPVLLRLPEIDLIDDKAGKPVGIHQVIGRRPVIAFGNSDGDFEMLEWTTNAKGPRLGVIVHHTDAEREWALRPRLAYRTVGARSRRRSETRVGHRRHEDGLESDPPAPAIERTRGRPPPAEPRHDATGASFATAPEA